MAEEIEAALDLHRLDAKSGGAHRLEQRPLGADADHLMALGTQALHQRQQEMTQREVDGAELSDLGHRSGTAQAAAASRT